MEKRNVVQDKRTPEHEITRPDDNWDKKAADLFDTIGENPIGLVPAVEDNVPPETK